MISRRGFFGALAGAVVISAAPKPQAPEVPIFGAEGYKFSYRYVKGHDGQFAGSPELLNADDRWASVVVNVPDRWDGSPIEVIPARAGESIQMLSMG